MNRECVVVNYKTKDKCVLLNWLSCYLAADRGNMAIITAFATIGLFGAVGGAVSMASIGKSQTQLQTIADNAALGAAREIIVTSSKTTIEAVAATMIKAGEREVLKSENEKLESETVVDLSRKSIRVKLSLKQKNFLGSLIGQDSTEIFATATAAVTAGDKLCVLSLDQASSDSIALTDSAKITADACDVQSNSVSTSAITAWNSALIKSATTCSVGGYRGGASNFNPGVITDCPNLADPLASRAAPSIASKSCDFTDTQVNGGAAVLQPGIYCGGLNISTGANVTFSPGIYVIRDGIFQASNGSNLFGREVGFYFSGNNATFKFNTQSKVEFYAPISGDMAGILFFSDRNSSERTQQINSEFAHQLVGTIYLPNDIFQVATNTVVADQSAYTVVIAKRIQLNQSPTLVLNANYGATNVPVPDGVATTAGAVLIK
jgi:Putative Flp pilus-assembly TadE/G-like